MDLDETSADGVALLPLAKAGVQVVRSGPLQVLFAEVVSRSP